MKHLMLAVLGADMYNENNESRACIACPAFLCITTTWQPRPSVRDRML